MNGLRTKLQMQDAVTPDERVRRACDYDLARMFADERRRDASPTWTQIGIIWAMVILLGMLI